MRYDLLPPQQLQLLSIPRWQNKRNVELRVVENSSRCVVSDCTTSSRAKARRLVLLHGNSGMIEDFTSSGIVAKAAQKYRVIVFDRPGFGYSERPGATIWTHEAQADLIAEAVSQIGVSHATILGHSWGASIAVALGLRHREMVSSLVLASGYYYPIPRIDVVVLSGPALPVIGDVMSYTISPLLGRLMQPFFTRALPLLKCAGHLDHQRPPPQTSLRLIRVRAHRS